MQITRKMKKILYTFLTLVLIGVIVVVLARSGSAPTSQQLISQYPSISNTSERAENKKILCPFLRIIERAGLLDTYQNVQNLSVSIFSLVKHAQTFGCGMLECGAVAFALSKGQTDTLNQNLGIVTLEKLHLAKGLAHDCGFTFAKGGEVISDEVRNNTLARLGRKANSQGQLSYESIMATKNEICAEQNGKITEADLIEVKLIYGFLGGLDRGFIHIDDVRRLFHAEMPLNKTNRWLRFDMIKEMEKQFQTE